MTLDNAKTKTLLAANGREFTRKNEDNTILTTDERG